MVSAQLLVVATVRTALATARLPSIRGLHGRPL